MLRLFLSAVAWLSMAPAAEIGVAFHFDVKALLAGKYSRLLLHRQIFCVGIQLAAIKTGTDRTAQAYTYAKAHADTALFLLVVLFVLLAANL